MCAAWSSRCVQYSRAPQPALSHCGPPCPPSKSISTLDSFGWTTTARENVSMSTAHRCVVFERLNKTKQMLVLLVLFCAKQPASRFYSISHPHHTCSQLVTVKSLVTSRWMCKLDPCSPRTSISTKPVQFLSFAFQNANQHANDVIHLLETSRLRAPSLEHKRLCITCTRAVQLVDIPSIQGSLHTSRANQFLSCPTCYTTIKSLKVGGQDTGTPPPTSTDGITSHHLPQRARSKSVGFAWLHLHEIASATTLVSSVSCPLDRENEHHVGASRG